MNRIRVWSLPLIAIVLSGVALAGGGTWVSDDGEVFDVSELADGESRLFGAGEKQVTALRAGDVVTISRPAGGDRDALSVTCRLDSDNCRIATRDDDPAHVMIMIEKTRECVNGAGDCDAVVELEGLPGDGAHIVVESRVECDDDGNCFHSDGDAHVNIHDILVEAVGDGHSAEMVFVSEDDGHAVRLLSDLHERVTLACPEGDTTMRVDKESAEDVFLCPQHSTPLEPRARPQMMRRMRVHRDHDPDD